MGRSLTAGLVRWAAVAALGMGVAACKSVTAGGSACTGEVVPGIAVAVRDSVSGASIAQGASGTITSGSYTEAMRPLQNDNDGIPLWIGGADERAGTYSLRITRPGYQTWTQSNVKVQEGPCHVFTTQLNARLVAAP
jgi:hypothetical protein